jgi:hypothetical protein
MGVGHSDKSLRAAAMSDRTLNSGGPPENAPPHIERNRTLRDIRSFAPGRSRIEDFHQIRRRSRQDDNAILVMLRGEGISDQRRRIGRIVELLDAVAIGRLSFRVPLRQGLDQHGRILGHLALPR